MWTNSMKVKVRFGVLSCEVFQSTEKVSWDTRTNHFMPIPSHWLPAGVNHVWSGRRQSTNRKPGTRRSSQGTGTAAQCCISPELSPLCTAAHQEEEQACPILLLYTPASRRVWHHPLVKSPLECGFVRLFVFILPFPELISRDRKARFACSQTWHCSTQQVGTDILALHSWGRARATSVGSAQLKPCL